jgi:hypothetical protein
VADYNTIRILASKELDNVVYQTTSASLLLGAISQSVAAEALFLDLKVAEL